MNKNEDYDWKKRLIWQCKQSYLSTIYQIITPEEYEKDPLLINLRNDNDVVEYSISISDVILRRNTNDGVILQCLHVDDLGDNLISEESQSMNMEEKAIVLLTCLNQEKFTESFIEFMNNTTNGLLEAEVNHYLEQAKDTPFPYPVYSNDKMKKFFKSLIEYSNFNTSKVLKYDILIRNFHQSIYRTRVGDNLSMVEAWADANIMRQCMINRLMYKKTLQPETVRDGLSIAKLAPKPSIFTTAQSIDLYQEYTSQEDIIFDYNVGFSGKLLAAILLGKKYYGITNDIEAATETKMLMSWIISNFPQYKDNISNINLSSEEKIPKDATVLVYEIPTVGTDEKSHARQADKTIEKCLKFGIKKNIFIIKDTKKYNDNVIHVTEKRSHLYEYKEKSLLLKIK